MSWTVAVEQDLCLSSGRCVAEAPAVFAFDEDELATVVSPRPGLPERELLAIARGCPSGAITLHDDAGARVV